MKAEREKIHAKVKADTVRLTGGKLELTADEEMCTFLLVSEGSCTLQMGENSLLLNPGSALLLGAGDAVLYLDRRDLKLPEGHYFIQDLIGLKVVDAVRSLSTIQTM